MTTDEQRIAIACAQGWYHDHDGFWTHDDLKVRHADPRRISGSIPDFCNDLNAMHVAEESLSDDECDRYGLLINQIRNHEEVGDPLDEPTINLCDWHATARQRAEAYLRTKNLWRDPSPEQRNEK